MPLYRCDLASPLQPQAVLRHVASLLRDAPTLRQSLKEAFGTRPENAPPFIGKVEGNIFRVHRDIRYRNSFLPRVTGVVAPAPDGSTIRITMHLHPVAAAFMLVWFGAASVGAVTAFNAQRGGAASVLIPAGMLVFGIALVVGGFFPEALKARHLLERGIGTAGA